MEMPTGGSLAHFDARADQTLIALEPRPGWLVDRLRRVCRKRHFRQCLLTSLAAWLARAHLLDAPEPVRSS